jgi:hypothetical protein
MRHDPDFSSVRPDLRDRFIDVVLTIVMLTLAVDGWLAYVGG